VAFDIRPPSAPPSNNSSSRKSGPSSGPQDPNTPLFSTQLAKQPSVRSSRPAPQPTKSAPQTTKSAPQSAKAASQPARRAPQPTKAVRQGDHSATSSAAGNSSVAAGSKKKAAAATKNEAATRDVATTAGGATTPDGTTDNSSETNSEVSAGGGVARAPDSPANVAAADASGAANLTTTSSDGSKVTQPSLLQLLAKSANSGAADSKTTGAASVEATADESSEAPGKATGESGGTGSEGEPDALTLAMLLQAFAGALGAAIPASGTPDATAGGPTSDGGPKGNIATGVSDATGPSRSAALQGLVSLLAHELATIADDKGPAPSSDPTSSKGSQDSASTPDSAAPRADSVAQSLAQLGITSHFTRATPDLPIQAPLGTPAWRDELATQLTWMTHRGLESGSLRLSPQHLGPVEVQITVNNGDASVWF